MTAPAREIVFTARDGKCFWHQFYRRPDEMRRLLAIFEAPDGDAELARQVRAAMAAVGIER